MKNKIWVKKGKAQYINKEYLIYEYVGTGYFPEVFNQLQNRIGRIFYVNYEERIIHISKDQEGLLNDK